MHTHQSKMLRIDCDTPSGTVEALEFISRTLKGQTGRAWSSAL